MEGKEQKGTGSSVIHAVKQVNTTGDGVFKLQSWVLNSVSSIIQTYQNEDLYTGVYSRDNLIKKIKYGAYIINCDG